MNSQLSDNTRNAIYGLLGLILLLIGLLIGQQTKSFTNAGPANLVGWQLDNFVRGIASVYGQTQDVNLVYRAVCFGGNEDPNADLNALVARRDSGDIQAAYLNSPGEADTILAGYNTVLSVATAEQCAEIRGGDAQTGGGQTGGRGLVGNLLAIGLVLAIFGALAYFFLNRGSAETADPGTFVEYDDPPPSRTTPAPTPSKPAKPAPETSAPVAPTPPAVDDPTPLGGFQTTYVRGDDAFDKSFIIENANGDFLGECGVSISESVGTEDGSRNVTAFEIWLFDKNDTHTVTKVVMSDHAFNDEAVRAKLAPRGEPILANYDNTVALETNSLIINADVSEIDYSGMPPSKGVFERFTVDLSAWVKSESEIRAANAGDVLDF